MLHNRFREKGFTIVELLIVIVVIAILAAISMVTYTNIQQKAKNTSILQSVSSWSKVLTLSYMHNGTINITLPSGDNSICLGQESDYPAADGLALGECYATAHTNDTVMDKINEIATVTTSVHYSEDYRGYQYGFDEVQGDGSYIWYELYGEDQDCNILPGSGPGTYAPAGFTGCAVDIEALAGGIPIDW